MKYTDEDMLKAFRAGQQWVKDLENDNNPLSFNHFMELEYSNQFRQAAVSGSLPLPKDLKAFAQSYADRGVGSKHDFLRGAMWMHSRLSGGNDR